MEDLDLSLLKGMDFDLDVAGFGFRSTNPSPTKGCGTLSIGIVPISKNQL